MKKLFLFVASLVLTLPAFAQLEQGQHMVGARLGLGFQLNNTGIRYADNDDTVNWGSLGGDVALSYSYLLTPSVGVGAEVSRGDFSGVDLVELGSHQDVEDDTRLYSFMLTTRLTANPQHLFRFYLPIGAGLVSATQDLNIDYHGLKYHRKKTDNSFGWFAGLGMEGDIGRHGWSVGFEMRYNAFWYETDKLLKNAPAPIHSRGTRRLDYMTFLFRVDKRF